MFDRFACSDAKPNIKRTIFVFLSMPGNLALNAGGAVNGGRGGDERCHDAVTEVLDFTAPQIGQSTAHNRVVHLQQFHGCLITNASSERGGVNDISKQNRANAGITRISFGPGEHDRAGRVYFGSTEEQISNIRLDLNNFSGDQAVRLTM